MLGKKNLKKLMASILAITMIVSAITTGETKTVKANELSLNIISASAAEETAYVTWQPVEGAVGYDVYVDNVKIDGQLIRNYGSYYRADALGLTAGAHQFMVVASVGGAELMATSQTVLVENYDRGGFAFVGGTASGAYNEDGTLKNNAVVLYLTEDTRDNMTLDVVMDSKGTTYACKGIAEILTYYKKGYDNRPLDIRVIGKVTNAGVLTSATDFKGDLLISGSGDTKRINCGITVEGVGNDAVAYGWGVRIKNASNVEIRNLGFMACSSGEGDNVGLQQSNDHIWVHNCDMFYGMAGGDSDQAKGDGALDCKKSSYVTFSYNHFWDNGKCNLLGLSEGTTENLFITYHHNWYDHSDSRHPRVRFYSAHVYNNYYDGNAKYGVGATLGSSVFVESNYFRNCQYPMLTSMQGSDVFAGGVNRDVTNNATFSKENGGTIKSVDNIMTGEYTFIPYGESQYVLKGETVDFDLNGTTSTADFDAVVLSRNDAVSSDIVSYAGANTYNNFDLSLPYSYVADAAENVPAVVTAKAGRSYGGDFTWTFDNETDDRDYGVNQALKAAVVGYQSGVVSIGSSTTGVVVIPTAAPTVAPTATTAPTAAPVVPGESETPVISEGAIVHNFTESGLTSDFFAIVGNLSTSKGTVNYAGLTLTQCLKIESATTIGFSVAADSKLTLVFNSDFAGAIKVDGVNVNATAGVLTVDIEAGAHTITKKDTCNLYYMVVEEIGSDAGETKPEVPTDEFVAEGVIDFTKINIADGITGVLVENISDSASGHGLVTNDEASKLILKLADTAQITVNTCVYNYYQLNTAVTSSTGTIERSTALEGSGEALVVNVINATGEVELTIAKSTYIHSIEIKYGVVEEPTTPEETPTPGETETPSGEGFVLWLNPDGTTAVVAGQQGEYPVFLGEDMAAKTNKITVDGVDYYSVQGANNPKLDGNNPNGAIPNSGAYMKVVAPADGTITVFGYPASGKPFYATKGNTAQITDGNAFCNDTSSYTVSVEAGDEWYFYAQGSKAQFIGVKFELPKASVEVPVEISGDLGDAKITFTNKSTRDSVSIGAGATAITLVEGYVYSVAIDSASLVIDVEEVDLTIVPEKIVINVSTAAKHLVYGVLNGLPEGVVVTGLVFTDEAGSAVEAQLVSPMAVESTVTYVVELKNGNYTASATVDGVDGYTVYDHVAVVGTEGEEIINDVWFYGPAKTYPTEYKAELKVGKGQDYETITEAIAAAKAMTRDASQVVTIVLTDVEYVEQVIVDAANIRLVAAEGVNPTVRFYYGIGYKYYSIDSTGYYNIKNANDKYDMNYAQRWGAVVRVKADGFYAEGINFVNTFNQYVCEEEIGDSAVGTSEEYGQSISGSLEERVLGLDVANTKNVERAAAVALDANNAEFYQCTFVSSQDTLYTGSAASYYNDCKIVGQTDYIFGNDGTKAIFDNCELQWLGYTGSSKAGYITATRGEYLFRNCEVTKNKEAGYTITAGYYGRPWGANATVTFVNTTIEQGALDAAAWYNMSGVTPEQANFAEYNNTYVDGTEFKSTYANTNAKFVPSAEKIEEIFDTNNDNKYTGSWTPVHRPEALEMPELPETPDVPEVPSEDDKPVSDNTTFVFEAKDLTVFAAGAKADGDEEKAGTDDYFTLIYSAKTKIDSSSKVFDDGYESSQRVNFGGAMSTSKNAIKFTTSNKATVTVWWVEGGDDNRQMAILDANGNQVAVTDVTVAKNAVAISTFELEAAGTYYLGGATNNNYIFKVEVAEEKPAEPVVSTFEAKDLTAFAAGAKADGEEEKAGTDDYFTLIYSAKTKIDSSTKTFEDGYTSGQRVNFGGAMSTSKNSIKFTTSNKATVKVWWVEGGDDNRQMAILDASGKQVAITDVTVAKNDMVISILELAEAGTYYLGGATNNNYIFKVEVTEIPGNVVKPARADWSTVEAPVITGTKDLGNGTVEVTVAMEIGYDGADKVVVTVADGENIVAEKASSKEGKEAVLTLALKASGTYTVVASAVRSDEEDKISESKEVTFVLPLAKSVIKSVANDGKGGIVVEFTSVAEAEKYIVTAKNGDSIVSIETTETSGTIEKLSLNKEYEITVTAVRGEATTVSDVEVIEVVAEAQRAWAQAAFGPSTNEANNTVTGSVKDGAVTIASEGGKGKIQDNIDGLNFYYTKINPLEENFTLTANIHVDSWTFSNGQEGFGMMVADAVGSGNTGFYNNSLMAVASKVEYTTEEGVKHTMKLGLGTIAKTGATEIMTLLPEGYSIVKDTLGKNAEGMPAGTYNLVGNYTGEGPSGDLDTLLTDFKLQIQRNNTGYYLRYLDDSGNVISEQRYYDIERNMLTQLDSDNIYVGFFAARNAKITVTDIELITIAPEEDEAVEEREIEIVKPSYAIEASESANSENYELVFIANADGKLVVKQGTEVIADTVVTANEKTRINTNIALGTTEFTAEFTPNADYKPGEYSVLESYETVVLTHVVTYKQLADGKEGVKLYVSPEGSSEGTGAKSNPIDIYTAFKYAAPGQTIVLMGGRYSLYSTVRVERGIDGTADKMIYVVADPDSEERPVFDFNRASAGMVLAGDYWYFKGFDVTNTQDAQKGIQVSGNNNVLDQINTYKNGSTGIQISRYKSTDLYAEWPANNLILNCTSYLNADKGYEDADGFAAKLTVGDGNVFDGCISMYNADDGWDLFAKSTTGNIGSVTIQNCVAYMNGYVLRADNGTGELDLNGTLVNAGNGNGFKMGGDSMYGAHVLKNSIAFANKAKGIDSNSCPDIKVYNSISYDNGSYNVAFYTNNAADTAFFAQGILSYKNSNSIGENLKLKGTQVQADVYNAHNYFVEGQGSSKDKDGNTVSDDWFVSLDYSAALGTITRNADGTINMNGLFELTDKADSLAGARMTGSASLDSASLVEGLMGLDSEVEPTPDVTPAADMTTSAVITSTWGNFAQIDITLTNNTAETMKSWKVEVPMNAEIASIWGATLVEKTENGYVIAAPEWEKNLGAGCSWTFTVQLKKQNNKDKNFKFTVGNAVLLSSEEEIDFSAVNVSMNKTSEWKNGFNGEIVIKNNGSSKIDSWVIEFDYDDKITNFYTAKIVSHKDNHYVVECYNYNAVIEAGQTLTLGFDGKPKNGKYSDAEIQNVVIKAVK